MTDGKTTTRWTHSADSRTLLLNAFERSGEGLIVFDSEDRLVFVNQKYRDLFPLEAPALVPGTTYRDIVAQFAYSGSDPSVSGREEEWINDWITQHRTLPHECEHLTHSGRWVRMNDYRMDDGGILGIRTDITDLKSSQQRLALHIDKTPLGAIGWDADFRCVEWNPSAERIFGFTSEEALGMNGPELIVPADIHLEVGQVFEALMSGKGGEHNINENVTKDGRTIICEWFNTPLVDDTGSIIGVASFVQDVTVRETANRKLQESEERFQAFYELIPDVFMITALHSATCFDVNDGFCNVTGYDRGDVVGKSTLDLHLWELDKDRDLLVQGLARDGFVNNLSANFRRKDGTLWPGIMSACVIRIDGEEHVLSATKDVSALHRSRQDALEASQAKSEFLTSMSHELRTPLNSILGFSQLLVQDAKGAIGPEQQRFLDQVMSNGEQLLSLINDMLDLASIESGRIATSLGTVSTRDVIADSVESIDLQHLDNSIRVEMGSGSIDPPACRADSRHLQQVLSNFLSNAIKYNKPGGHVIVDTVEIDRFTLRISVQDTGQGIPEDLTDKLFIPFDRLGRENTGIHGTGVGLALSKKLAEAMEGVIGVESKLGKGSTFWIDLPIDRFS